MSHFLVQKLSNLFIDGWQKCYRVRFCSFFANWDNLGGFRTRKLNGIYWLWKGLSHSGYSNSFESKKLPSLHHPVLKIFLSYEQRQSPKFRDEEERSSEPQKKPFNTIVKIMPTHSFFFNSDAQKWEVNNFIFWKGITT